MSAMKVVGSEGSNCFKKSGEQSKVFRSTNSLSHSSVQVNETLAESNLRMCEVTVAASGAQAWNWAIRPNSDCRCLRFSGLGNSEMAVIRSASGSQLVTGKNQGASFICKLKLVRAQGQMVLLADL